MPVLHHGSHSLLTAGIQAHSAVFLHAGEAATRKLAERLLQLALPAEKYAEFDGKRLARTILNGNENERWHDPGATIERHRRPARDWAV